MIKIQKEDFVIDQEIENIKNISSNIGATSTFIGYVRKNNNKKIVKSIQIEVYKEMAIKNLNEICNEAKTKWNLINSLVIHRYGKLYVNEKIVLVSTFAEHRKNSFDSCNYIMEYLKKSAPFWKKEFYKDEHEWLQNLD
tara:strand:- start:176 stop:592 length:417 start_codon:yes stop_codon:yes gene_type:complete